MERVIIAWYSNKQRIYAVLGLIAFVGFLALVDHIAHIRTLFGYI